MIILNLKNNEKIYLMPKDFFESENFVKRFTTQLLKYKFKIQNNENKDSIKDELETFYLFCQNSGLNDKIKIESRLYYLDTLKILAEKYSCNETFLSVIEAFEYQEFKEKVFSKHTSKANLVYGETLFLYYRLLKSSDISYTHENTEYILRANYYLFKSYIQHIEGVNQLDDNDLSGCLKLLSVCLADLSRWFEPLYLLNIAKQNLKSNIDVEYLRAVVLESLMEKTCLNFNGLLLLKIIDSCLEAKKITGSPERREQLNKIEIEARRFIKDNKQQVSKLRTHKARVEKSYQSYSPYKAYCIDNQLYLNEHSFYCNCSLSTRDDLKIETSHDHTKIAWARKFDRILDNLIYDFITARYLFYNSLDGVKNHGLNIRAIKRKESTQGIKNAQLKASFKTLYSILDQIAHGILKVMEIDYQAILKTMSADKGINEKIYFLNMWDENIGLFETNHFNENFYLVALYSISKDLSKSRYGALKDFKKLRNAMEHKILHIIESETGTRQHNTRDEEVCTKSELIAKTEILMLLTKSAIFSFTYLIRRQSINIEKREE